MSLINWQPHVIIEVEDDGYRAYVVNRKKDNKIVASCVGYGDDTLKAVSHLAIRLASHLEGNTK